MFDGKAFGQEIVTAVKQHMAREIAPLLARLDEIDARLDNLPAPKEYDPEAAARMVIGEAVLPRIKEIEDGLPDVAAAIEPLLKRIEGLEARAPQKGEQGIPGERGQDGKDGQAGRDGVDGINGKDFDPAVLEKAVSDAFNRIEKPKDGTDGINGKDGRDGCGVKDVLIDRNGCLILTMDDGRIKELGAVIGKDGAAGVDGKDGAAGVNGVGFDDLDEELRDGGRIIVHRYRRGNDCIEFEHKTAFQIYRGVFKEGATYERGDTVTWGGSQWHCDEPSTTEKPDSPAKHWTLSTKRGRDGKDADGKGSTKPVKV